MRQVLFGREFADRRKVTVKDNYRSFAVQLPYSAATSKKSDSLTSASGQGYSR